MSEQRMIWWVINELEDIYKIFNFSLTFCLKDFDFLSTSKKVFFQMLEGNLQKTEISMTPFQTENFAYEDAIKQVLI